MVDTRRSAAAKPSSEEASPPPTAAAAPVEAASPLRSRSGKRSKAERTGAVATAAGAKEAAVDVLDSSVDNLDMARSTAAVAASSTVSNPGVKKKRTSYLRSAEGVTLWKTRQTAEAWGRLISQSSEYPSIPICSTHFTVGHGGKYDLRLTESSPGSLVCKLKHVKRGAALDIYVSKVVCVNGKALDKAAKVTLIGGDGFVFSSLGRHAYIFQKLPVHVRV